jgi:hypothetical protein
MTIDCGRCETRGNGCRDCVITVLGPPNVAGYLGEAEVRALGVLADAGLVPPLRLRVVGGGPRTWAGTAFPAAKAS